jgi:hypothetical protein
MPVQRWPCTEGCQGRCGCASPCSRPTHPAWRPWAACHRAEVPGSRRPARLVCVCVGGGGHGWGGSVRRGVGWVEKGGGAGLPGTQQSRFDGWHSQRRAAPPTPQHRQNTHTHRRPTLAQRALLGDRVAAAQRVGVGGVDGQRQRRLQLALQHQRQGLGVVGGGWGARRT